MGVRPEFIGLADRHPATLALLRWFEYEHLRAVGQTDLRVVSRMFHDVAHELVRRVGDGPELSAGLRKLLEAKDCGVRAAVDAERARAAAE